MKLLIVPVLPLLLISLTLHDPESPVTDMANNIAVGFFACGGGFIILYALARVFRLNH